MTARSAQCTCSSPSHAFAAWARRQRQRVGGGSDPIVEAWRLETQRRQSACTRAASPKLAGDSDRRRAGRGGDQPRGVLRLLEHFRFSLSANTCGFRHLWVELSIGTYFEYMNRYSVECKYHLRTQFTVNRRYDESRIGSSILAHKSIDDKRRAAPLHPVNPPRPHDPYRSR